MADGDLCTLDDVKSCDDENILANITEPAISGRITAKSTQIRAIAVNPKLTSDDDNARFACVYDVLRSFQVSTADPTQLGSDQQISSKKEGDLQINYTTSSSRSSSSDSGPSTYNDWFWFYMNRIIPRKIQPCPIESSVDPDWM